MSNLTNILVIVVRYFGVIKLGENLSINSNGEMEIDEMVNAAIIYNLGKLYQVYVLIYILFYFLVLQQRLSSGNTEKNKHTLLYATVELPYNPGD